MGLGDFDNNPAMAPRSHRRRFSLFAQPADATATDPADADERHELVGDAWRAAAITRQQERKVWAATHGDRALPIVDADGHVVVPAEVLAQQADEAAAQEVERLAGLTPARLDAVQTRRWVDWLAEYQLHRPTFLRLDVGPRGEMLARQSLFSPYEFRDEDERHPDGGRVIVRWPRPVGDPSAERASLNGPRAFPNARVLDAIRQQFLMAWWLRAESNKPTPPPPLTIDERLAAMTAEREARAAAKRRPDHNWKLIIEGGRGW